VIFFLTFAQVAKSVQISLFLSNEKPQVNGVHKNQPPLHIPTKRIFYHLHLLALNKTAVGCNLYHPGTALCRNF